jgi:hypothetical protein
MMGLGEICTSYCSVNTRCMFIRRAVSESKFKFISTEMHAHVLAPRTHVPPHSRLVESSSDFRCGSRVAES